MFRTIEIPTDFELRATESFEDRMARQCRDLWAEALSRGFDSVDSWMLWCIQADSPDFDLTARDWAAQNS